jgi:hypothetical protein
LRGGGAADEAARARDMSWEAVLRTTPPVAEVAHGGAAARPAAP